MYTYIYIYIYTCIYIHIYICMYVLYYTSLKKDLNITKYNERKHRQMSLIMTKDKSSEIHIGEIIVKSGACENLLGAKIDSKLHF